jgi:hypothetical protein
MQRTTLATDVAYGPLPEVVSLDHLLGDKVCGMATLAVNCYEDSPRGSRITGSRTERDIPALDAGIEIDIDTGAQAAWKTCYDQSSIGWCQTLFGQ